MAYKQSGPSLYPNLQRSSHGYRIGYTDSKSKVLPGDKDGTTISMKEENGDPLEKGDIKGVGLTTGKTVTMKPGETHVFKGDSEVLETPLARISIGSKTYDDLDPEMRSAVEGQLGMPTQEQLEEEKEEKDDPNAQNIKF